MGATQRFGNDIVSGDVTFDDRIARQELDNEYGSKDARDSMLKKKAADDIELVKAREEGYTGPAKKFVIPDVDKADMRNAMKVDLRGKLDDMFGVEGSANGHGQLSRYGASANDGGFTGGFNRDLNVTTGDTVADTLYANYKGKNWSGGVSQKDMANGDRARQLSAMYEDGGFNVGANGGRTDYANGKHNNTAGVNLVYTFPSALKKKP